MRAGGREGWGGAGPAPALLDGPGGVLKEVCGRGHDAEGVAVLEHARPALDPPGLVQRKHLRERKGGERS